MKKTILITTLILAGCSDPDGAKRAVEALGLTDVQTHGWSAWGCGKGDDFTTRFSATNAQGKRVTGVVCGGWLKGSTVRID